MPTPASAPVVASAPTIEFIFHGTGTSSSVPNISCLTANPIICETCGSTLTSQGQKNKRRNTGGILRVLGHGQCPDRVIVIDVGKTFLPAAYDLFPRYGLRRIDAVILTHPHADAMNGLDDLRGWTLRGKIQEHIDIYVSAFTFKEVQRSFPYLVAKEFATGGGDIPEFKWHIIKENEPFRVKGLDFDITPIAVHHGRLFMSEAKLFRHMPTSHDTPDPSGAATPSRQSPTPSSINPSALPMANIQAAPAKPQPYICLGYIFGDFMVYISDVSHIPEDAWETIRLSAPVSDNRNKSDESIEASSSLNLARQTQRFKVLVIDCLKLQPHTSHFGIEDAVNTAKKVNAQRTYMVGFSHRILHSDWETIGEYLGGKQLKDSEMERPHILDALRILPPQRDEESIWIRPAYDGLRLFANSTDVWEDPL